MIFFFEQSKQLFNWFLHSIKLSLHVSLRLFHAVLSPLHDRLFRLHFLYPCWHVPVYRTRKKCIILKEQVTLFFLLGRFSSSLVAIRGLEVACNIVIGLSIENLMLSPILPTGKRSFYKPCSGVWWSSLLRDRFLRNAKNISWDIVSCKCNCVVIWHFPVFMFSSIIWLTPESGITKPTVRSSRGQVEKLLLAIRLCINWITYGF